MIYLNLVIVISYWHLKTLKISLWQLLTTYPTQTVADPGFPVGAVDLVGGVDSRGGYVSKILYVETKKSGPLGGVRRSRPLDPPMPNSILGIGGSRGAASACSFKHPYSLAFTC